MLIAMAGLPGTGKSSLAARLAGELGAVVLSKDALRSVLFPGPVLDYSREQDDICMTAIGNAAAHIRKTFPAQALILDGRTFLRAYQVNNLLDLANSLAEVPVLIECRCADETARQRLTMDLTEGRHPAGNRTFALYLALQAAAEPIPVPHMVLDTGKLQLDECIQRCLIYLKKCQLSPS
jgi:predicted kinase